MSRGDELWSLRTGILKGLYDVGAISDQAGVVGVILVGQLLEGLAGRHAEGGKGQAVSKGDVETLLEWLEAEGLIAGVWDVGGEKVWLTSRGFMEARAAVEAEGGGEPYYVVRNE